MIVPFVLFVLSLAGVAVALLLPEYSDLLLIAGPAALASLYLLLTSGTRDSRATRISRSKRAPLTERFRPRKKGMMVLDGSNVMHWKDGEARLETVREVIDRLTALGFKPGVIFDANAGYKLENQYRGNKALARQLRLSKDRVMVVDKGVPADPVVLDAAGHLGARVVSNDRFRDWEEDHPELKQPGYIIRGGYRDGKLWLSVDGS